MKGKRGGNVGIFSKQPKVVAALDPRQAAEWIGLPAGTIFRDDGNVASMYCAAVPGLEPGGYYPCTIVNKGNTIAVSLGGKVVSYLDKNCLGDGAEVLARHRSKMVRALLYPRAEGRKTASVYARI